MAEAIRVYLTRYDVWSQPLYIAGESLRLDSGVFFDRLLADQGLELGRYDGRITVKSRPEGTPWLPTGDPSLRRVADLMNGTSWIYNGNIRHDLSLRRSFKRQFDVFVEAGK